LVKGCEVDEICYVLTRAWHIVVPEMREVAASPFAPAIVGRASAPAHDRARSVSLPRLQLARLAERVRAERGRAA
jgi:hypothetical protein